MEKKFYIDSNIFIYAATGTGIRKEAAETVLEAVNKGKLQLVTSVITYDEMFWTIKNIAGKAAATAAGDAFFSFANLAIVELSPGLLAEVHHFLREGPLNPRDAIHYVTLRRRGLSNIITEDTDFDHPALRLKRHTLTDMKKQLSR